MGRDMHEACIAAVSLPRPGPMPVTRKPCNTCIIDTAENHSRHTHWHPPEMCYHAQPNEAA
jgi:hypothetical protein